MRRLVIDSLGYLQSLARALGQGWSRFFFTPADPTPLGVIRVIIGALAFWNLLVYGLDLQAFLGSNGWADARLAREIVHNQNPMIWSFWFSVPDPLLRPVWIGCLVVLALFTLGMFSRVTAVLAWVIVTSTLRRATILGYGYDQVACTLMLYLAVAGASGQAVSLDRFFSRWKQFREELRTRRPKGDWSPGTGAPTATISANIALRLIQLHLVLIYGMAGIAKLQGQGWWAGFAVWPTLVDAEFGSFDLSWLASFPLLINFLTHLTIALELGYPTLVWIPNARPLLLALVVVMHLGISFSLGLVEFALAMIAANVAFVSGAWLRSLVAGRTCTQPAGRVLYDGACPRCRRSVAALCAADPSSVVMPLDLTAVEVKTVHPSLTKEACMTSMHLVRRDGRVFSGFDAVVRLARWTPIFWPLGLVGGLPGIVNVGRKVYNWIAATRPRDVPCTDEVCALPSGPRREAATTAPRASESRPS